jgi:quercetin dioxygenase-like cupin family protein
MRKTSSIPKKATTKPANKRKVADTVLPTPRLQHISWNSVEQEVLNPLLERQLMVGHKIMLSRIYLKKGCVVPLHSHHNEQISYILEGTLSFSINDHDIVVRAGEVLAIPPYLPHRVEALADSLSLDIFTPPREDWLNGSDRYLRVVAKK